MSLPGPSISSKPTTQVDLYALTFSGLPEPAAAPQEGSAPTPVAELKAIHASVARCLRAMAQKVEEALPAALASARQAWDRVDTLNVVDRAVTTQVAETRRALQKTISTGAPTARATALEGLVALDTAWGLTRLFERRLSSLIRLRVLSGQENLLPNGRPFLDLSAALNEAARAWS